MVKKIDITLFILIALLSACSNDKTSVVPPSIIYAGNNSSIFYYSSILNIYDTIYPHYDMSKYIDNSQNYLPSLAIKHFDINSGTGWEHDMFLKSSGNTFIADTIMNSGATINNNQNFNQMISLSQYYDTYPTYIPTYSGKWLGQTSKYFPVKVIKNNINYLGWVRISLDSTVHLTVHDFALAH